MCGTVLAGVYQISFGLLRLNDDCFEACLDQLSEPRTTSSIGDRHDHCIAICHPVIRTDRGLDDQQIRRHFTPVFAVAAGWFAGVIAQAVPGAHLNQNQIVAFMTAAAVSALTAGWKWLQGWQQHEALVAQGLDVPVKAGPPAAAAVSASTLPQAPIPATAAT